jgi:hypothetical protein
MRKSLLVPSTLLAMMLLASSASAQTCAYIPPPRAPDFQNTLAYYYSTCFGMTYGPNHCVRPPFAPFQGMLPGPFCCANGQQSACLGTMAFPHHMYARSPRDFFMYDVDPRSSPYAYGFTSSQTPFGR